MKNKAKDLDVDFIGGQESLTKEEERAISAFLLVQKEKNRLKAFRKDKKKSIQKTHQKV